MTFTIHLSEKELREAVAAYVTNQGYNVPAGAFVTFSTIEGDHGQGKETTASVRAEAGRPPGPSGTL